VVLSILGRFMPNMILISFAENVVVLSGLEIILILLNNFCSKTEKISCTYVRTRLSRLNES
jgi:hypothetical protein